MVCAGRVPTNRYRRSHASGPAEKVPGEFHRKVPDLQKTGRSVAEIADQLGDAPREWWRLMCPVCASVPLGNGHAVTSDSKAFRFGTSGGRERDSPRATNSLIREATSASPNASPGGAKR